MELHSIYLLMLLKLFLIILWEISGLIFIPMVSIFQKQDQKNLAIIRQAVKKTVVKIELTIKYHLNHLGLTMKDCLVMGFSQGGMMTFELGNSCQERLGALAILSGQDNGTN